MTKRLTENMLYLRRQTMVNKNDLTVGATCGVTGKVQYSHITKKTSDREREKINKQLSTPISTNYSLIILKDVIALTHDVENPTVEERYASEQCFGQKNDPNAVCFKAINMSDKLPIVAVKKDSSFEEIQPDGELDVDLDVSLVLQVVDIDGDKCLQLNGILVNEPIRYYGLKCSNLEKLEELLSSYTA